MSIIKNFKSITDKKKYAILKNLKSKLRSKSNFNKTLQSVFDIKLPMINYLFLFLFQPI